MVSQYKFIWKSRSTIQKDLQECEKEDSCCLQLRRIHLILLAAFDLALDYCGYFFALVKKTYNKL